MRIRILSSTLVAGLALATWAAAPAAAQCCTDHGAAPCCADHAAAAMPECCRDHVHGDAASTAAALSVLLPSPVVQTMTVTFHDPVKVGTRILFGRYVIEHDNDRMARGEPCTYIYAADDRRLPVVTFHCTHLDRGMSEHHTVVLGRGASYPLRVLREFQFAGEFAAHGVPGVR